MSLIGFSYNIFFAQNDLNVFPSRFEKNHYLQIGESTVPLNVNLKFHLCRNPMALYNYQRYYMEGFKAIDGVNFDISPFSSKPFAKLVEWKVKGSSRMWKGFASVTNAISTEKRSIESDHVGRYIINIGGKLVKVAIDSADGRNIRDPRAFDWADFYFKANKWPSVDYPAKVHAIVNGNGLLDSRKIDFLKTLRNQEAKIDLIFISRVWSSPEGSGFFNGIEHQIRLFETLASLDCSKKLMAIIPPQYSPKMMDKFLVRLDSAGVLWTYRMIPASTLWTSLAEAKIVFLRAGMHLCIPWRMLDLLCMGLCIVYDRAPYPQWPVPLLPGKNYMDCDCGLGPEQSLPSNENYVRIKEVIESLLFDNPTIERIRKNNCEYFDASACPQEVARYIIDTVQGQQTYWAERTLSAA